MRTPATRLPSRCCGALLMMLTACAARPDAFRDAQHDATISLHALGDTGVQLAYVSKAATEHRAATAAHVQSVIRELLDHLDIRDLAGLRVVVVDQTHERYRRYFSLPPAFGAYYESNSDTITCPEQLLEQRVRANLLRHEVGHAVVQRLAPDAPSWINEGFAQSMEAPAGQVPVGNALQLKERLADDTAPSFVESLAYRSGIVEVRNLGAWTGTWVVFESARRALHADPRTALLRLTQDREARRPDQLRAGFLALLSELATATTETWIDPRGGVAALHGWELDADVESLVAHARRAETAVALRLRMVLDPTSPTERSIPAWEALYDTILQRTFIGEPAQPMLEQVCATVGGDDRDLFLHAVRSAAQRSGCWETCVATLAGLPWPDPDRMAKKVAENETVLQLGDALMIGCSVFSARSDTDPLPLAGFVDLETLPRTRAMARMLPREARIAFLRSWSEPQAEIELVGAIADLERLRLGSHVAGVQTATRWPFPEDLSAFALQWVRQRRPLPNDLACTLLRTDRLAPRLPNDADSRPIFAAIWSAANDAAPDRPK